MPEKNIDTMFKPAQLGPFVDTYDYLQELLRTRIPMDINEEDVTTRDLPAEINVEGEEYDVEYSMGIMIDMEPGMESEVQYLVKWLDWHDRFNSWNPIQRMSCTEKMKPFEKAKAAIENITHGQFV